MTHLAMAFAIAHPGVTSAIIGPRTILRSGNFSRN
jgi:aryl-alcohol dehydrogenase-like predicted oxidoreductase